MELMSVSTAAEILGVPITRIHQYLRDGHLVGVRDAEGVRRIPALLLQDGAILKSLPSVITQLRDARYNDAEIVEWLFREDDSLPGSPVEALRANRGTEVKRRAQVAGY
ncbi:MAG: Rv2175c family DNA-binding protein [Actinomycetota bacterium]|nr:Rv2175c family DNA-binding protein [Actinomycetota bacterium]